MKYKLYTDGSFNKNNSGIGCIGGYIENSDGDMIDSWSEILIEGNMQAHEIRGILLGIKKSIQHGIKQIDCYTDHQHYGQILNSQLSKYFFHNKYLKKYIFPVFILFLKKKKILIICKKSATAFLKIFL